MQLLRRTLGQKEEEGTRPAQEMRKVTVIVPVRVSHDHRTTMLFNVERPETSSPRSQLRPTMGAAQRLRQNRR